VHIRPTREIEKALETANEAYLSGLHRIPGKTIITGSLRISIWRLSLPLLLIGVCAATVDLVHVQCAGYLSTKAQAIIGICDQLMLMAVMALASLSTAITASISKLSPLSDDQKLSSSFADALKVSLLVGIVLAAIVFFAGPFALIPFSGCVESCDLTRVEGERYLRFAALSLIPISIFGAINAFFLGTGRSAPQLITILTMALIDSIGSYLLMTNASTVKSLGISSIAISTLSASVVALIAGAILLATSPKKVHLKSLLSAQLGSGWDMLKRSIPATLQDNGWAASAFVLYIVLGMLPQPADVVAALNTGQRIEALIQAPLAALASAVLVVVGQNLGAKRAKRAWRATMIATLCGCALMLLAGVLLFFFAEQMASFGNNSESTRPFVAQYLRIAALGLSFVGLETILTGSLQACEDTKFPLLIGFICSWAISIPFTYILAITFHMESQGAWIALLIANLVAGLAMLARFTVRPEWKAHTDAKEGAAVTTDESAHDDSSAKSSIVPSQRPCVEIAIPYASSEPPANPPEPQN